MAQTVIPTIHESLNDYDNNLAQFYITEIVLYAVGRRIFRIGDTGRLGTSAVEIGMGKIRAETSIGKYIVEFFNKATIHGLNHIVAPYRHFVERVLTVLFVGIALACLVTSSLSSWNQYKHDPTSMVLDFDYKQFHVTKPAVTVCLDERISVDKFTQVFNKFGVQDTPLAREFFVFISNSTYLTMSQTPLYNGTSPDKWLKILQDLYIDLDIRSCSDDMCVSANVSTTDIVTEMGICTNVLGSYAVYLSTDYWFADNWMIIPEVSLPTYTYAQRTDRSSFFNIPGPYQESIPKQFAYAMIFHHPKELPMYGEIWFEMGEVGMTDIEIEIRQVESSVDLKKLSEGQRRCNYPNDGNIKMTPVYTQNMCIMECRYNFIRSKCGCYPHFARPMAGIPICNATQLRCIGDRTMDGILMMNGENRWCNCPRSCETANYKIISANNRGYSVHDINYADRSVNIDVQFPFYKLRHEVFFGINEFLVSVGGASGLFLGASIISFVEIFYYITLRLFWYGINVYREGKERWNSSKANIKP